MQVAGLRFDSLSTLNLKLKSLMSFRLIILLFFVAALFAALAAAHSSSMTAAAFQGRGRQTPRAPATNRGGSRVDYTKFSHATEKHKGECNSCHRIPTAGSQKAKGFPDVTDYPSHAACLNCHRPQFFKGARPEICKDCHTRVSPRDDARYTFPNPNAPQQFQIEFPHDKHQNVIALLLPTPASFNLEPRMLRASFNLSLTADEQKHYNNCEICHAPNKEKPQPPPAGWADAFAPTTETFKASPDSHAFCFNCHWSGQKPDRDDCGGCHKLAAKPFTPQEWFKRNSLKFTHARADHILECTVCHINITKSASLRGLSPDVPISSCKRCHWDSPNPQIVTIPKELDQKQKNAAFACAKCHTSEIGKKPTPASHLELLQD